MSRTPEQALRELRSIEQQLTLYDPHARKRKALEQRRLALRLELSFSEHTFKAGAL
jgi:hypothetical protein